MKKIIYICMLCFFIGCNEENINIENQPDSDRVLFEDEFVETSITESEASDIESEADIDITGEEKLIKDPNFEKAVRNYLKKTDTTERITKEDLESIKGLYVSDNWGDIYSLEGVEYMTNITSFKIGSSNEQQGFISDLSPFKDLKNLETLSVSNNPVEDITPLLNITSLESLKLSSNNIDDISGLHNLENLRKLSISSNPIEDITVLVELPQLEFLSIVNTSVKDYSAISYLQNLRVLGVGGKNLENIEFIKDLESLYSLSLVNSSVEDLSPLNDLDSYDGISINIGKSPISDISPLERFEHLQIITITGTDVKDLSPLKNMKDTFILYLQDNQIEDISIIANMPKLQEIVLRNNKISDISALGEQHTVVSGIDISQNYISDIAPLAKIISVSEYFTALEIGDNCITDFTALENNKFNYLNGVDDQNPEKCEENAFQY